MIQQSTRKAATLADVARATGVSLYTVSTVLNGARSNTRVSPATRLKIQEAAKLLRYHPNAMARSLTTRRTNTLGILFPFVRSSTEAYTDDYAVAILQGIVAYATEQGYDILHYTQPWRDDAASIARLRDRRTDGVLVIAPIADSDVLAALSGLDIPVVAISALSMPRPDTSNASDPIDAIDTVDVDNAHGIGLGIDHLIALGHTRIAHLTGEPNAASSMQRHTAWEEALRKNGIDPRPEYCMSGTYDGEMAEQGLRAVLALPEPPTAIIAGNDHIALRILSTAQTMGIRVPEDLSVIGFDNIATAERADPPLTTVCQPVHTIGETAARLLIDRIKQDNSSGEIVDERLTPINLLLKPRLILRASTASPNII